MNLENLTLPELLEIQKQLPAMIARRQEEVRKDVLQKASQLAARHGLTLEDLVGKGRKRHAPKYRNPEDETQMWTGVGSRPKWVRDWLTAGKSLDELRIPEDAG
jgi:DNA-binding protein H-NS